MKMRERKQLIPTDFLLVQLEEGSRYRSNEFASEISDISKQPYSIHELIDDLMMLEDAIF